MGSYYDDCGRMTVAYGELRLSDVPKGDDRFPTGGHNLSTDA